MKCYRFTSIFYTLPTSSHEIWTLSIYCLNFLHHTTKFLWNVTPSPQFLTLYQQVHVKYDSWHILPQFFTPDSQILVKCYCFIYMRNLRYLPACGRQIIKQQTDVEAFFNFSWKLRIPLDGVVNKNSIWRPKGCIGLAVKHFTYSWILMSVRLLFGTLGYLKLQYLDFRNPSKGIPSLL